MILIGLGANLPSPIGEPVATCAAAILRLQAAGVTIVRCSPWYRSAPVPPSDQPWFVNGVAAVDTALGPETLLTLLHATEAELGRVRTVPNAARVIDLDLLAYGGLIRDRDSPRLPHPRLQERAFVLVPLAAIAPGWRHPVTGVTVEAMIHALPPAAAVQPA